MSRPRLARRVLEALVSLFGTEITDQRTGTPVARAIILSWRGKIYLIGYRGRDQVMPMFLPQERVVSWKRVIGFTTHPRPDFPREVATKVP